MLKHLTLHRPLAVFDLETTGTDTKTDRIVEISVLKLSPDGEHSHRTRRVNPGVPIPPEASAVHGITDQDVANEPPFASIAAGVAKFLDGCDLCGFNLMRFDLRLLMAEFRRADQAFDLTGRSVVDAMTIFHDREKRDLTAALRFYCDRDHEGAHGAAADVLATAAILDAQVGRYGDLPRTVGEIHTLYVDPDAMDFEGNFRRVDGVAVFNFGKYKGRPLAEVAAGKPDYLGWMLGENFYEDTKALIREALEAAGE